MSKSGKIELNLPTLDDLFSTQEERDDAKLKRIYEIPLNEIDDFPDHPFKVLDDEDMFDLVESVKEHGIITPATVRQKEDGRYELLSGHRRKRACELAGLETLRTEIVDMDRDSSIIFMVDSNLQRTTILPSEKGFSYKMRLEAMNRKAGRPAKNNLTPVVSDLRTNEILGKEVGESRETIRRYIRITELVPELIDLVDSGEVSLRPAVELSYLPDEEQYMVLEAMETEVCTPSHAQTIRMRRMFDDGKLTQEAIEAIMQEEKPNQKEKLVIRNKRIWDLLPKDLDRSQTEDFIVKAVEHYNKLLRKRELDRGR